MSRNLRLGILIFLALLVVVWFALNRKAEHFGFSFAGFTTYGATPIPYFDIQVRGNGEWRTVSKTQNIDSETLLWLSETHPQVLIIGQGYGGKAMVQPDVLETPGCEVKVLKTREALQLYNSLRDQQSRVAIHVRSSD
jgi:hypothetical protein